MTCAVPPLSSRLDETVALTVGVFEGVLNFVVSIWPFHEILEVELMMKFGVPAVRVAEMLIGRVEF
jgi:hypothetical protein